MTHRKLIIVIVAGVVALGLGYGLMGLAAPDASGAQQVGNGGFVLDEAALQAALAGADGTGPRVVVVDAISPSSSGSRADGVSERYDDYDDDDHGDDRDDDDHDDDHDRPRKDDSDHRKDDHKDGRHDD